MRRVRIFVLLFGALATFSLVSGCDNSTLSGSPAPTTSDGSSGSAPASHSESAGNGAPKVAHPLNATPFTSHPCLALTSSDLSALGFGGAQPVNNSDASGAGCGWSVAERTVGDSWLQGNPNGLSDIYAEKSTMAYWHVLTVSGYPGVEADAVAAKGSCEVIVGVNDHLAFFADMDGADTMDQACATAKQVAAAVIANLKAAQGGG